MDSKELLTHSIKANMAGTLSLLEEMQDAALTFPTPNGGNHPLWILGHLTYSVEEVLQEIMLGLDNPLKQWQSMFGYGSEPTNDATTYPEFDVVLAEFHKAHNKLLTTLDSLSEDDLDTKCPGCPSEYAEEFGTYRLCILALSNHLLIHRGQVADARRAIKRQQQSIAE